MKPFDGLFLETIVLKNVRKISPEFPRIFICQMSSEYGGLGINIIRTYENTSHFAWRSGMKGDRYDNENIEAEKMQKITRLKESKQKHEET